MAHKFYQPPKSSDWSGRVDEPAGPDALRWHQAIQIWDVATVLPKPSKKSARPIALLGFACDAGVKRNQGRIGASEGPRALRKALASLPAPGVLLLDAGTVICPVNELEDAQTALTHSIGQILTNGAVPILLGGGHEIAWPHFRALAESAKAKLGNQKSKKLKIGIVNFDAHLDLRDHAGGGNSGTSFHQMAEWCAQNATAFSYLCVGAQGSANTARLFDTAKSLKTKIIPAERVRFDNRVALTRELKAFAARHDLLYVTLCLDVFAHAFAPGVSAPQPLGIFPDIAESLLKTLAGTGKLAGFDVAELCPPLDRDDQTAKLAARMIWTVVANCKS